MNVPRGPHLGLRIEVILIHNLVVETLEMCHEKGFVQRHFTHHSQFSSLLFQNPVHSFTPLAASTRSRLRFYSYESDSPVEKKPDPVIESASVAEAHVKDVALPVEDVSDKGKKWVKKILDLGFFLAICFLCFCLDDEKGKSR
ncbi:hypothetical protein Gotur_026172 [Gossypium turneri]